MQARLEIWWIYKRKPNMDDSGTWSVTVGIIREWYVVLIKTDKIEWLANSMRCHCDIQWNTKTSFIYPKCIRNRGGEVKNHCAGLPVKWKLCKYPKLFTVYTILRNSSQRAEKKVSPQSTPGWFYNYFRGK